MVCSQKHICKSMMHTGMFVLWQTVSSHVGMDSISFSSNMFQLRQIAYRVIYHMIKCLFFISAFLHHILCAVDVLLVKHLGKCAYNFSPAVFIPQTVVKIRSVTEHHTSGPI